MLHFLDAQRFPYEEEFLAEFGQVEQGSTEHLTLLQSRIAPYFLRRIKEDVEKVPPQHSLSSRPPRPLSLPHSPVSPSPLCAMWV